MPGALRGFGLFVCRTFLQDNPSGLQPFRELFAFLDEMIPLDATAGLFQQGYDGLKLLIQYLLMERREFTDTIMPIDIITPENLGDFLSLVEASEGEG